MTCNGTCTTIEPYWQFCPMCGQRLDHKTLQKLHEQIYQDSKEWLAKRKDIEEHRISWICGNCGGVYGKKPATGATWHYGTCDVCDAEDVPVTEPRDFGVTQKDIDGKLTT
jgi:Zn finger protein HypA/HybF involved in hydrogenase expression